MYHSPFISTPLTDFSYLWTPNFFRSRFSPQCHKLELRFIDCLEAYGLRKGSEKCAELLYDLTECNYEHFQKFRVKAIQNERLKQYRAGKLAEPFEKYPPLDSYLYL